MNAPAAPEVTQSSSRPHTARAGKSKRALSIKGLLGVMADERQPPGTVRPSADWTPLCIGTSVDARHGHGSAQWSCVQSQVSRASLASRPAGSRR